MTYPDRYQSGEPYLPVPVVPSAPPGNSVAHQWPISPAPQSPVPAGPPLVQIGDVQVTQNAIITPVGIWPLRGSVWAVVHHPVPQQKIATWALVLAIVSAALGVFGAFFTCGISLFMLFGLFFLMAKETTISGPVMVTVQSGHNRYNAQEFVYTAEQVHHAVQRVNYAQLLANS